MMMMQRWRVVAMVTWETIGGVGGGYRDRKDINTIKNAIN